MFFKISTIIFGIYIAFIIFFMSTITWGMLEKSLTDNETVEQAIGRIVQEHDDDANAHLDTGQSLQSHKASEIIDHAALSVLNDKIEFNARAFSYIVDVAGGADYDNLQDAINQLHSDGGGRIFVKNGTYTLDDDITLYSDIEIIGEDNDNTVFDFNETTYQFLLEGVVGTHLKNIIIRNIKVINSFNVDSVIFGEYVDNLQILDNVFVDNYDEGEEVGGAISLSNCDYIEINGNSFSGDYNDIYVSDSNRSYIVDNYFSGTIETSVYLYNCTISYIQNNYFSGCLSWGVYVNTCSAGFFVQNNKFLDNAVVGIAVVSSHGGDVSFNNIKVDNGYYAALYLLNSNFNTVIGNNVSDCSAGGIDLTNSDRNVVKGNEVNNNGGTGIIVYSSSCDKNIIVGNVVYNNTTAQITDNGTGTVVANNVVS